MKRSTGHMNLRDCLIYIGDIVVFSKFEQHNESLEAAFRRLQINNLKLKASKYDFFKRECTNLGVVKGIHTDPSKIETVQLARSPDYERNIIRMFKEFTRYYRRFVK